MASEFALVLKNLSKRFEETVVLDGLSLEVFKGEFMVLLGPSGCGKTTTLKIVAGLIQPDEGEVAIHGRAVNNPDILVPPEKRNIGMVFQNLALWPHMTVSGNLKFVLKGKGLGWKEKRRRIDRLLHLVKMEKHKRKTPEKLSGGEAQRVAIARALVTEPELFLLDEPLANLDEHLRELLMENLLEIQENLKVTVLYVCHSQVEAFRLARRVAVMERGRLAQVGTPVELYKNPANPFVAGFIGTANFFEGNRTGDGKVETPLGEISLPLSPEQGRLLLALRPEDIRLTSPEEGIKGFVKECIFQGNRWLLKIILDGFTLKMLNEEALPLGSEVYVKAHRAPTIVKEE